MGEEKAGDWRSMANGPTEGYGEVGEETCGKNSIKIPRANPCDMFPRNRNLDAGEKTTRNIVGFRVKSLRGQSAKVYI